MNRDTKLVMRGKTKKYNSEYQQRYAHTASSRMFYHLANRCMRVI